MLLSVIQYISTENSLSQSSDAEEDTRVINKAEKATSFVLFEKCVLHLTLAPLKTLLVGFESLHKNYNLHKILEVDQDNETQDQVLFQSFQ